MKCRCLTWHVSDTKHVFNLRCQCYKYFERMIFDFYICICNWQVSIKTKIVKEIIWFSLHYFSVNYNNYVIFNQKKNVFYIFASCYSYCFELIHDFFMCPVLKSQSLKVTEMKAEYFPPKEDVFLQNEAPTDFYILVTGAAVRFYIHIFFYFLFYIIYSLKN